MRQIPVDTSAATVMVAKAPQPKVLAGRHQVRIDPEGEPRIAVAEVETQTRTRKAISAMYRAAGHAHDGPETAQAA